MPADCCGPRCEGPRCLSHACTDRRRAAALAGGVEREAVRRVEVVDPQRLDRVVRVEVHVYLRGA